MSSRRIVARPSHARLIASRRRGRLAPLNGSVTRADIAAIYADCTRGVVPPPTAEEFFRVLLGAIQDPVVGPRTRAKIAEKAREREARKRAQRQSAIRPPRTLAAA